MEIHLKSCQKSHVNSEFWNFSSKIFDNFTYDNISEIKKIKNLIFAFILIIKFSKFLMRIVIWANKYLLTGWRAPPHEHPYVFWIKHYYLIWLLFLKFNKILGLLDSYHRFNPLLYNLTIVLVEKILFRTLVWIIKNPKKFHQICEF